MDGAGGMAIVSASTTNPSIHVAVYFNGVFGPDETADVPVNVRLESQDHQHVVLEQTFWVSSPNSELNEVSASVAVSSADLRLLTSGRMALSVVNRREPSQLALRGGVGPRVACDIFQAPLTASDTDADAESDVVDNSAVVRSRANTPVTGQAWMFIAQDGSLVYNIQVTHVRTYKTFQVTHVRTYKTSFDQVLSASLRTRLAEICSRLSGILIAVIEIFIRYKTELIDIKRI